MGDAPGEDDLRVERLQAEIAVLVLDRAERRNALSIALRDHVSDALDALARDEDLKAVVVAAEGEVFCAGFDLKEFERAFDDADFADRLWASSDRYHQRVLQFPLPTIAAVDGPALGGGFDLAVMCDIRVASERARFAHPEHAFGDVVYGPLHDIVGAGPARDLCFTGREIDAAEALRLHLVSQVCEPGHALDEAIELARRVALAPREILMRTKAKALRRAGAGPDQATLDL